MTPPQNSQPADKHHPAPWWLLICLTILTMTQAACQYSTTNSADKSAATDPLPTAEDLATERRKTARLNAERIKQETAQRVRDLETRYSGQIHMLPPGQASYEAGDVMFELMREWNPLFASSNDLNRIIGEPSEIDNTNAPAEIILTYSFDSGRAGTYWQFTLSSDRVIAIRVLPGE